MGASVVSPPGEEAGPGTCAATIKDGCERWVRVLPRVPHRCKRAGEGQGAGGKDEEEGNYFMKKSSSTGPAGSRRGRRDGACGTFILPRPWVAGPRTGAEATGRSTGAWFRPAQAIAQPSARPIGSEPRRGNTRRGSHGGAMQDAQCPATANASRGAWGQPAEARGQGVVCTYALLLLSEPSVDRVH